MDGKLKNKVELNPRETPQPRQLTKEEKELDAAIKTAIAKTRKDARAVTLVTLAKRVQMTAPVNADLKTVIEYIRGEITKNYEIAAIRDKIVTIYGRIGNDVLPIEVVLLDDTAKELIEEFLQKENYDALRQIVDAELDTVLDYKQ